MTGRPLTRALRAAKAAGLEIARVEIMPDGRIVLVAGKPIAEHSPPTDALDEELERFRAGRAGGR